MSFLFSRSNLTRAASLVMLAGGALLLMADSAECPDGVAEAKLDLSFTSTCPTDFAPKDGNLHILLPGGKNESDQESALRSALRSAGFDAPTSQVNQNSAGGDICTPSTFTFSRDSGSSRLRCGPVSFSNTGEQRVTCDGSTLTPLALRVGARDFSGPDGSTIASDASTTDASSRGTSSSCSTSVGNTPGIGDGEDRGNGTSSSSGSSGTPSNRPLSCTITFNKI